MEMLKSKDAVAATDVCGVATTWIGRLKYFANENVQVENKRQPIEEIEAQR